MSQPDLFSTPTRFDSGVSLTVSDHVRLGAQLQRVLAVMADGAWWSVPRLREEIALRFGVIDPEPSLSAQIRNAKKAKHGGHHIERRHVCFAYEFRIVRVER